MALDPGLDSGCRVWRRYFHCHQPPCVRQVVLPDRAYDSLEVLEVDLRRLYHVLLGTLYV